MKFADNIVASTQKRPTTADEKKLFTTKADKERANRDKYMCLDLLEYKKEYKQQRRQLRRAMNKYQKAERTIKLTSADRQRVNENKWIEVTKSRKTSNLVTVEAPPVQCSNGYEALAEATIKSPPQQQSDNDERGPLPY